MAQVDGGHLVVTKHRPPLGESDGYTVELPVPGEISVSGVVVRAVPVPAQFAAQAEPGTLLRAEALGERLIVRNWWPGDRYRPAHSGSEEKLKRLFSKRHVPVMPRRSWPVALKDRDIVYVYGFAVAEDYCWRVGDGDAIRIECTTIA